MLMTMIKQQLNSKAQVNKNIMKIQLRDPPGIKLIITLNYYTYMIIFSSSFKILVNI